MIYTIHPSTVSGSVRIPASKSHTIRALLIAAFAAGTSTIHAPLLSEDTHSCLAACRSLGALIDDSDDSRWVVQGIGSGGSEYRPELQEDLERGQRQGQKTTEAPAVDSPMVIDTGNSGTTLYLLAGMAAAAGRAVILTGDAQIRNRPSRALTDALASLGAQIYYGTALEAELARLGAPPVELSRAEGCPPFLIRGPLTGGRVSIESTTSQYLSSLLLAAPLSDLGSGETAIDVPLLNERPYIDMTLAWLDRAGITYTRQGYDQFTLPAGQSYQPVSCEIPGDFSSASFFFCTAAITGDTIIVTGLDRNDHQGDKEVLSCLERMGCSIAWDAEGRAVTLSGPADGAALQGCDLDLNAIPDALPILAATACYAEGTTRLLNVPQARIKETDRIAVMAQELTKLGAELEELPDGLIVRAGHAARHGRRGLLGGTVDGHGDHRVIMALATSGLAAAGPVSIQGAEAVNITFPTFFTLLESICR